MSGQPNGASLLPRRADAAGQLSLSPTRRSPRPVLAPPSRSHFRTQSEIPVLSARQFWQTTFCQNCRALNIVLWAALNVTAYVRHWDPYPFILMNLVLSLQAAYTGPVVMMSQNRMALRDRIDAQHDYELNQKAELEVRAILDHLAAQDRALEEIHGLLSASRSPAAPSA